MHIKHKMMSRFSRSTAAPPCGQMCQLQFAAALMLVRKKKKKKKKKVNFITNSMTKLSIRKPQLEMFQYHLYSPDTDSDTCAVGISRYQVPILIPVCYRKEKYRLCLHDCDMIITVERPGSG